MAFDHCRLHLPGNVPCPNHRAWRLTYEHNQLGAARSVSRDVCSVHLEAGILDSLQHAVVNSCVKVTLVGLADPEALWPAGRA